MQNFTGNKIFILFRLKPYIIVQELKSGIGAARVAQQFSAAFSPGCGPGDPGSSATSGSLHGNRACFKKKKEKKKSVITPCKKKKSPLKHSTVHVLSLSKGTCQEFCVFVLIIYEQESRFL